MKSSMSENGSSKSAAAEGGLPKTEDEFLKQQADRAREALMNLRGELLSSLGRTADLPAWTRRYPWHSLATAAVAGLSAGAAIGLATRKKPDEAGPSGTGGAENETDGSRSASGREAARHGDQSEKPANRLVHGVGTLMGIMGSAVAGAAAQAVAQVVKESLHDALRPGPDDETKAQWDEPDRRPAEAATP